MSLIKQSTPGVYFRHYKNGRLDKIIRNEYAKCNFMVYKNIPSPQNLKFQSKFVNDFNQHLCNGWFHPDICSTGNQRSILVIERVIAGQKPFGNVLTGLGEDNSDAVILELLNKARTDGFIVTNEKHHWEGCTTHSISISGKLNEVFNLEALKYDYKVNGFDPDVFDTYKNIDLNEFHTNKYDVKYHPIEITGLILGYPIENTISLMKE